MNDGNIVNPAPPRLRRAANEGRQGGGGGGGMEARLAKLEAAVEHIQSDIRDVKVDLREVRAHARTDFLLTWSGLVVGFVGIATMMAKGFRWL
jgi:hypothetical protein